VNQIDIPLNDKNCVTRNEETDERDGQHHCR
jgi:hypothetical protein